LADAADPEIYMDLFAPSHLLIILLIILVIFGPSKLGDVGGAMGKAIRDFKRAMNDPDDASKTVSKTDEARASETRTTTEAKTPEIVKPDKVS
jgi:sec-independent protein translocase protein TatA